MRKPQNLLAACALAASAVAFAGQGSAQDSIVIQTQKPGALISPMLYGIFFEEINRAGDGGIYAEMIQNRNFDDNETYPIAWFAEKAKLSLDRSKPLNESNKVALRVQADAGARIVNKGFVGGLQGIRPRVAGLDWQERAEKERPEIAVREGEEYELSMYAAADAPAKLVVALEDESGERLAAQEVEIANADWKRIQVKLVPNRTCANAVLAIRSPEKAEFLLDMVSLFPAKTWKNRPNGLRPDLMAMLEKLRPAFVRFPGGCFVEGKSEKMENAARWKDSVGPVETRPGQWCIWQYQSTNGLGYHEFLQMCEDLGAEPLFVINCGMGHSYEGPLYSVPMEEMDQYVQDALDAIEYANGPVDSKWGALRAAMGHPEPFNLKYMEIGNENWGKEYAERYALFHKAIKEKHPEMNLIANEPTPGCENEIVDPHMYAQPLAFLRETKRFDKEDRNGPKIYFGEYAVTLEGGKGNLQAAIGEAAFMTGMERNGDHVIMSSYAPLFCREGWLGWQPDAIFYDQSRVYGTPSFWIQQMFSANRPDRILPLEMNVSNLPEDPLHGIFGIGTWDTSCEFKNIRIEPAEPDGEAMPDWNNDKDAWRNLFGDWTFENGTIRETSLKKNPRIFTKRAFKDAVLTFQFRRTAGTEGFRVFFGSPNDWGSICWNYAGWGGGTSNFEGQGMKPVPGTPVSVETGRWYDVRMEIEGSTVRCFVDGKLIHEGRREPIPAYASVAGLDEKSGETILKFVNADKEAKTMTIRLDGAEQGDIAGTATTLQSPTSDPLDENSFDQPEKIVPKTTDFRAKAPEFSYEFPARSVVVLRWKSAK